MTSFRKVGLFDRSVRHFDVLETFIFVSFLPPQLKVAMIVVSPVDATGSRAPLVRSHGKKTYSVKRLQVLGGDVPNYN